MSVLTVETPSTDIFESYWYGYGHVVEQTWVEDNGFGKSVIRTVVDYGNDMWRCENQAARFASGLYFTHVEVNV